MGGFNQLLRYKVGGEKRHLKRDPKLNFPGAYRQSFKQLP